MDGSSSCEEEVWSASGLAMHLVVDESLAMVFPRDLWTPLGQALDTFVAGSDAAPSSIGVQFFQGECDAAAYATPSLPLAPVVEHAGILEQSMSGRTHGPGAATALALSGAGEHARAWAIEQNQRAALVLITGSEPTGCFAVATDAAAAAGAGLISSPAVPTYVIALRARAGLDAIARAGGTGAALPVSDASSEQELAQALQAVAARAACEIALPDSAAAYLPDRVNLRQTENGQQRYLPRVADADACGSANDGFYYDDPLAPKRILVCPQTCADFGSDDTVEIVYGCQTVTL